MIGAAPVIGAAARLAAVAAAPPKAPPVLGVTTRNQVALHSNQKVVNAMEKLADEHNPDALSIIERNRRLGSPRKAVTPSNKSSGREVSFVEPVEETGGNNFELEADGEHLDSANVVEPADLDAVSVLQSLVMIDKFDGDFADVALVMDEEVIPGKQWTEEVMAAVSIEHGFKVPGSFDEAWNHPCPFLKKMWRECVGKEIAKMDQHGVWMLIRRSSIRNPQAERFDEVARRLKTAEVVSVRSEDNWLNGMTKSVSLDMVLSKEEV